METSSDSPTVSDTRQVFDRLDDPGTPLTTGDVAAKLDTRCRAARRHLETLSERDELKRKQIGPDGYVWWRPVDRRRESGQSTTGTQHEEEFRALVQAVEQYAIFMLDTDGRIRTWNEGAERIKGYDREEVLGEYIGLFYPDDPDAADDPERLLNEAAAEGSVQSEGWRVQKDGSRFWAHVTINALYDDDGDLRGYAKITRDLSERHRREQALRRERDITQQFQLLVDSVSEYAIFMMDTDGYVQSWNVGAEQVKGYSEDEIVGKHFSTFYPDEAVEEGIPEQNLEAARTTGHVEDEGWRVRKSGERFWADVTITAVRDDDGDLRGFAKVARDMTEQHAYEERIRREKERFRRLVEEVQDYAIFMLDPDGRIQTWNRGAEQIKGYEEREVLGEHISLFYPDDNEHASADELLAQATEQGRTAAEGWRVRKDGSRFWASVVITALYDDDGDLRGFAKITRDLTDRKRRESRLAALDEVGRDLLAAESPEAVGEIVVDAAESELDLPISTVALYDEDVGALRPTCRTTRAERLAADVPFLDPATDAPWEAFANSEPRVVDDPDDESVTGGVIVPLGRHGVFIAGYTDPGDPSDEEVDFAKIIAATLEAALHDAERQQLLREREETLSKQNESLERLNRINDVVRAIDRTLVEATTREEIERAVCDELAAAGPYQFAWIGHYDSAGGGITPETWAGIETSYLDDVAIRADGTAEEHPACRAARSKEPVAMRDIRTDPPFEEWRREALQRGYRSMISVPILYEDTLYGVLTVHATRPDTFAGMERQVIEEFSETVGHAINALESKQALVSDEVVELRFALSDPELPVLQLTNRLDCAFELENVLSRPDESLSVFFTTRGAPPDDVSEFVERSFAATAPRLVTEESERCLFEATVTRDSFVATLIDHGAVPRTLTAEGGAGHLVVDLGSQADVREFVEMLQTKYDGLELTARRTRDRTTRTPGEFKAAFEDRITDRQQEVLQIAYFSGYFDTPRKSTGQELGDTLGISQPTVNHHLRACQRELLGMLYEEGRSPEAVLDR